MIKFLIQQKGSINRTRRPSFKYIKKTVSFLSDMCYAINNLIVRASNTGFMS